MQSVKRPSKEKQTKLRSVAIRRPSLFQLTSIKRFKCTFLNTHILLMADYDSKPSRWIFTGRRKPPISPPKHNDLYKRRVSSASTLQITNSQTTPPPPSPPLSFIISILLQMKLIREFALGGENNVKTLQSLAGLLQRFLKTCND